MPRVWSSGNSVWAEAAGTAEAAPPAVAAAAEVVDAAPWVETEVEAA